MLRSHLWPGSHYPAVNVRGQKQDPQFSPSFFKGPMKIKNEYNICCNYFNISKLWYKSVAILGWTELAKYRILQEEQKTNTAPFWAIYYHFETWLNSFLLFHPNYVSKCNKRPLLKARNPNKGLNPLNSNNFSTRLSGLTHFIAIRVIRHILQGCKQNKVLSIYLLKIEKQN